MSYLDLSNIGYGDTPSLDAFGNLRTSWPETLFSSKITRGKEENQIWTKSEVSGGTVAYNTNKSEMLLTVLTASGAKAIRQSKEYIHYNPGKSQKVLITGRMGAPKSNVRQRIGLFDESNGLFFEQTSSGLGAVIRSNTSGSAVDSKVLQSSWNKDVFADLDISKVNIFFIDFQWLGVGRVRFGFVLNGVLRYCHEFHHASLLDYVYMQTPDLPVRYEIENTGTSASSTDMSAICAEVSSEGGNQPKGLNYTANTQNTVKSASNGVKTPLISIRLKAANNKENIIPTSFSTIVGGQNTLVELSLNSTLTGGTWVSAGADSSVEYNIGATAMTGGRVLYSETVSSLIRMSTRDSEITQKLSSDFAGISDILTVSAMGIGGNSTNCSAAINWMEEL